VDVYALGLVLLESLTGVLCFPASAAEAALARLHRCPVVPGSLPSWLQDTLRAMTARDPERRPPAGAVADALHARSARALPAAITQPTQPDSDDRTRRAPLDGPGATFVRGRDRTGGRLVATLETPGASARAGRCRGSARRTGRRSDADSPGRRRAPGRRSRHCRDDTSVITSVDHHEPTDVDRSADLPEQENPWSARPRTEDPPPRADRGDLLVAAAEQG